MPSKGVSKAEIAELFENKRRQIYNFFVAKGFSREESRELTQETFYQAFKDRHRFQGRASLGTWLHAIAKNLWRSRCRDSGRQKRSGTVIAIDDIERQRSHRLKRVWHEKTTAIDDAAEQVLRAERERLVWDEIDRLPPRMGQCLRLYLRKGLQYGQIAALLGVSVGTVKSNVADAKARLRTRCAEHFES